MWFLTKSSSAHEVHDEAAWDEHRVHEEAEELRLKLEALRMAEYREQQRASIAATRKGEVYEQSSAAGSSGATHYVLDDGADDLETMYDFSKFVPLQSVAGESAEHEERDESPLQGRRVKGGAAKRSTEEDAEICAIIAERVREAEDAALQREESMQQQMLEQEKKLTGASRALQKARHQVQQLSAQVSLKEIENARLKEQTEKLRFLLAEKEKRLQVSLDQIEKLTKAGAGSASSSSSVFPINGPSKQEPPTELVAVAAAPSAPSTPSVPVGGAAGIKVIDVAQAPSEPEVPAQPQVVEGALLETDRPQQPKEILLTEGVQQERAASLGELASELTVALERSKASERELRRHLKEVGQQLQNENLVRQQYEQQMQAMQAEIVAKTAENQSYFARIELQVRALDRACATIQAERSKTEELFEKLRRIEVEEKLQQVLASKGKKGKTWYPHLEV